MVEKQEVFPHQVVKFAGLPEDKAWKQLKHELLAPTYKIMSGKVVAESKDEMKKRGLRSPNLADALNTTFFQDYETFKESYTYAPEREQRNKKKKICSQLENPLKYDSFSPFSPHYEKIFLGQ